MEYFLGYSDKLFLSKHNKTINYPCLFSFWEKVMNINHCNTNSKELFQSSDLVTGAISSTR